MEPQRPTLAYLETQEVPAVGLADGGRVVLVCSNCQAGLARCHITRPHEPEVWQVRAVNCPFCDDHPQTASLGGSYVRQVRGGFHLSGFGLVNPEDETDEKASTVAEVEDMGANHQVLLRIRRWRPDSQPIRVKDA